MPPLAALFTETLRFGAAVFLVAAAATAALLLLLPAPDLVLALTAAPFETAAFFLLSFDNDLFDDGE